MRGCHSLMNTTESAMRARTRLLFRQTADLQDAITAIGENFAADFPPIAIHPFSG
jgi:hypothetical protein